MINYSTAAGGEEGVVVRVGHEQEKQTSLSLLFFFRKLLFKIPEWRRRDENEWIKECGGGEGVERAPILFLSGEMRTYPT